MMNYIFDTILKHKIVNYEEYKSYLSYLDELNYDNNGFEEYYGDNVFEEEDSWDQLDQQEQIHSDWERFIGENLSEHRKKEEQDRKFESLINEIKYFEKIENKLEIIILNVKPSLDYNFIELKLLLPPKYMVYNFDVDYYRKLYYISDPYYDISSTQSTRGYYIHSIKFKRI